MVLKIDYSKSRSILNDITLPSRKPRPMLLKAFYESYFLPRISKPVPEKVISKCELNESLKGNAAKQGMPTPTNLQLMLTFK